jgi:hypothetical protein
VADIFAGPNPKTVPLFEGPVQPSIALAQPYTETGKHLDKFFEGVNESLESMVAFLGGGLEWFFVDSPLSFLAKNTGIREDPRRFPNLPGAGVRLGIVNIPLDTRSTGSSFLKEREIAADRGATAISNFFKAGPGGALRAFLSPLDQYTAAFDKGDADTALNRLGAWVPSALGAIDLLAGGGPIATQPSLVTAEGFVMTPAVASSPPPSLAGAISVAASATTGDPASPANEPAQEASPPQVTSGVNLTNRPSALQAGMLFQGAVDRAASFLFNDPGRFRLVLSPEEYSLARSEPWLTRIFVGTGVERYTAEVARALQLPLEHLGGPYNPDFLGVGRLSGFIFDVYPNTEASYWLHFNRPYGPLVIPGVYLRPFGLYLLP